MASNPPALPTTMMPVSLSPFTIKCICRTAVFRLQFQLSIIKKMKFLLLYNVVKCYILYDLKFSSFTNRPVAAQHACLHLAAFLRLCLQLVSAAVMPDSTPPTATRPPFKESLDSALSQTSPPVSGLRTGIYILAVVEVEVWIIVFCHFLN